MQRLFALFVGAALGLLPIDAHASRNFVRANSEALHLNSALVSATPLTVSLWFRSADLAPSFQILFSAIGPAPAGQGHFIQLLGPSAKIRATTDAGAGAKHALSSNSVVLDQWQHACAVFASATQRHIYLDAVKVTNTESATPTGIAQFNLGYFSSDFGEYFSGRIAEVGVWNVALTDDEVAALAKGVSPLLVRPQSLIDYFPLVGSSIALEPGVKGTALSILRSTKADTHPRVYGGSSITDSAEAELQLWQTRVVAAGGTFAIDSVDIARALITQLRARSYSAKIRYLLPLLGSNLAAARVPLRDAFNVGAVTNVGFVDADFSQSTGLQGDGTTKHFDTKIKPSDLGTTSAGVGAWVVNLPASTVEAIAYMANVYAFGLVVNVSSDVRFYWGNTAATAAKANGHYYGQIVSQNDKSLYKDGALSNNNTAATTVANASTGTLTGMAINDIGGGGVISGRFSGRLSALYMTDGTLTAAEITDFHALLQTYLITPTGR